MTCKEAIYSQNTYDYITDYPVANEATSNLFYCYETIENMYNILYLERSFLPNMETDFFEYQGVPKLYGLMQVSGEEYLSGSFDPTSLIESGIIQVQGPPLNLTGQGVVMCFIDTGIDYTSPVFRDEFGNSRILALWDQTIEDGTVPQGFSYGAEYTNQQINEAIASPNPFLVVPSRDENGHGTSLAAVGAGSNLSGRGEAVRNYPPDFRGAAPQSSIVVVKLKEAKQYLRDFYVVPEDVPAYQENDIMLGVKYCDSFARLFQRPVVICIGLGTNMGDHNGNSALSRYLSSVAIKRNRAVVVCGGNEGNAGHHFQGDLRSGLPGSTGVFQDVEVRVDSNNPGFIMELWGNLPDVVNVSVRSPGGENIPPIRLGVRQSVTYGFVYESSSITIDSVLVEPSSGEELMLFRLKDPTAGIWTFRVSAIGEVNNGIFHMWLPITQFLGSPAYFLRSTPEITLTEPSMAQGLIAVSDYNAENGSFAITSGRGFSRTGAIRPDLCAPGVNIPTTGGVRSGSGYGAAITAGAVAQFLQWAVVEQNTPFAESLEIQSYLILGATRDPNLIYPNREWGYGKLNLVGAFERLRGV